MKKLLLVLLVVALASFLFVGCLPTTPAEGEGEGEGEGEVGICPTVSVTSQQAVGGKNYIKKGIQTITVTFAVPTEPVSVYIGTDLRTDTLLDNEVVMYTTDKLVYTGDFDFGAADANTSCGEAYIYVSTCDACDYCKFAYTVDGLAPTAKIELCVDDCSCDGCEFSFTSTDATDCGVTTEDCGDACSALESWSIKIYEDEPFDECCDASCETPIDSASGVCPIDFTTNCLTTLIDTESESVFAVVTLVDVVGNEVNWGVEIGTCDYDTCETIWFNPIMKQYGLIQ